MAEEYNDRFKSEVMRLLSTLILKVDGLEVKVDENKGEIIEVKQIVNDNTKDLRILSGQFTDVTQMVLKDNQRITKLETEVEDLKSSIH
jgi:cell division protein FtsL